jgi:hypothetical protein
MMLALIAVAIVLFACRVLLVQKIWDAPLKNGPGYFLAQPVKPGFYQEAGAALLKRYRIWVLLWLLADAPLAIWLAVTGRYSFLLFEQLFAEVMSVIGYNIMLVHFTFRAASLAGFEEDRPAAVQLSMTPRRLRDHMHPVTEIVVAGATLISLVLLARDYALSVAPGATHAAAHVFHRGIVLTAWLLYWQIGFLLLKGVYVRWRMPLPANRTEDFRRWRTAWLNHHLRTFDAVRLLVALSQLGTMAWITLERTLPRPARIAGLGVFIAAMVVYATYVLRESRRLAAAVREMKPVEMVKEFPRAPVAAGRYLAGGFIYFNPENPGIIVRGVRGVAINLAHRSTYAWGAYLLGLAALMAWMGMIVH